MPARCPTHHGGGEDGVEVPPERYQAVAGGCLSLLSTHPLTQNHYAMTIAKYTVTEPLLDLNMDLGEGCVWVSPSRLALCAGI